MRSDFQFQPGSLSAWRGWLAENHSSFAGVWLVNFKKGTGRQAFSFDEAIEEALCFGWIDSLPRKLDEERSMLWFSPRKAASAWSGVNKKRVAKLMAEGRMQPAGLAVIAAAKKSGAWTRIDSATQLKVPPELVAAFGQFPGSAKVFEAFPPSSKRAILEWIAQARTDLTRSKRVTETARLAAQNIRANHWREIKALSTQPTKSSQPKTTP